MVKKHNLAFKVNYCDGIGTQSVSSPDSECIGFRSVCSPELIEYNVKKHAAGWCANPECDCRMYYDGKITYEELKQYCKEDGGFCMESRLLNEWRACAEYSHYESDAVARPIRNAEIGSLAVLTTVLPHEKEEDRKIFAVFIIGTYSEEDLQNGECGFVKADPKYRLELTRSEASQLNFWDFYHNTNTDKKKWGQGVFRYMYDDWCSDILKEIVRLKKGTNQKSAALELYHHYCRLHEIAPEV